MRDNDQILLEEAFTQVDEGILDRIKAKSGTRLSSLGNKALGGISKVAGDTRLGRAAGELQQQGEMDVEEQRASQLMKIFSQKLDKVYAELRSDASKIGVNLDKLAQEDYTSKGAGGAFPAIAGISAFLRGMNQAKDALRVSGETPDEPEE